VTELRTYGCLEIKMQLVLIELTLQRQGLQPSLKRHKVMPTLLQQRNFHTEALERMRSKEMDISRLQGLAEAKPGQCVINMSDDTGR
jgi:hypothetical protein